jgi:hypothetical protein
MLRKTILFITLLLFFLSFTIVDAKTNMTISCPTGNQAVNDKINVTIIVKPDQEIDTVAIDLLSWDKKVLELEKIDKGNLFEDSPVWLKGTIDKGTLTGVCWGCNIPTLSEGKYITLTFKCIANGKTLLSLDTVGVANAGLDVPVEKHNCYIQVGETSEPDEGNGGGGGDIPPDIPDIPVNETENDCEEYTNETIIPVDETENETIIPVDETKPVKNDTYIPNNTIPVDENINENLDDFHSNLVYYVVIILIVLLSIFVYLIVRYYKNKEEEQDDEEELFLEDEDDETNSGSKL